ncbi:MAG: class I tRNA ligase family protein [Candidatus Doudnabacteria bacterium]|nr:class I tRNA ligase family protein [Candidatus Doudnabacteria bacterium]
MNSKNFDPKPNFAELEEQVLDFWEKKQIFQRTLEQTKEGKPFVFYEGPPTANAKPALHHVEARAFKDLIPRYQTMRGRYVMRKAGWDTHGLPVELQIEKKLEISGKKQIESIRPTVRESIIEFNRLCKQSVWEYKDEWEKMTTRMGYWIDLKNPYITYHNKYIESVWDILKEAWQKDLVYLGYKVLPYCTRCGTALSSHEVAQGYKTVKDNSVYVKFKLKGQENTYILSWTTTPWTLPGNVALAVNKNIEYWKVTVDKMSGKLDVIKEGDTFYFGKGTEVNIFKKVFGDGDTSAQVTFNDLEISLKDMEVVKGKSLIGLEYEPLFDVEFLKSPQSYKVYDADFVTITDGTGVVHTAVVYGEDDYTLGEKVGLPKKHTVDETGNFVPEVKELAGLYVKDEQTEGKIFGYLKAHGNFLKKEKYEHEYPHCWRCGTPLLYYARDSWFIKMSQLREDLIKNNEQISWNPDHIKYGRFGNWIAEVKDWPISRDRYWGTPLPIWKCNSCEKHQIVGSIEELNLNKNHFLFARHGESDSVVQGIHMNYPEIKPIHLTELGNKQAQAMADQIKNLGGVDMIFASDLTRTKETAEIVSKIVGVEIQYDPRLREYNLGIYNGKKLEEYHNEWPLQRRWQEAPEGGETYMQLQNRMLDFVNEINAKYNSKRILIVTHGDVIWLLNQYYDMDNHYPQVGEFSEMDLGLTDLHRPYIDEVALPCKYCGGESKRITQVMDVWFDSGAMPYAQWHTPFENKKLADTQFPADFISEAIDQTRGWFYTLLAISTILGKGPAFKNVICLGHLLDDKGLKMSKSKGNIIDPWTVINKQGIDALRWYMYSINQPGDSKLFAEKDLDLIVRKNFLTLWNVLSFFVTYSNYDKWSPDTQIDVVDVLDQWILVKTQELVNEVTTALDGYDAFRASRKVEEFINELSTWYVRRSRERKGPAVYQTLHKVLKTLSLLLAPFVPFLSENIWQVLRSDNDPESVHLAQWPKAKKLTEEAEKLLKSMDTVREAANVALNARKELALPIRQPLARLAVQTKEDVQFGPELAAILVSEVNVKKMDQELVTSGGDEVKVYKGTKYIQSLYLDTVLTPELKIEGFARNIERLVQDMRKKTGLKVGEMVNLSYDTSDEELRQAMGLFDRKKTFVGEINAEKTESMESAELDGKTINLSIKK